MFKFKQLSFFIASALFITACGNSDGWFSRQWHNTNAHYNMYFNAEQLWESTALGLREAYVDDYRGFIELYNYGSAESLKGNQGSMDDVVKIVSTMIDKHPKSRWVDDAYLLMGKAYFLKGDFFAARDIFEFVITNFKDPIIQYKAKLWIFQSIYYQGKFAEAESLANTLKNDPEFPKKLLPDLNKALSAVYLKSNKPSQAVKHLELCLEGAKGKMERYRLHFALGQAYQQTEKYVEAEKQFAKVVKMNPPYEMAFNSRINQVELLSLQENDYIRANKILKRMLHDDKNIDYYGQIYYRMGKNELRAGNNYKAILLYNQSLMNSAKDRAQSTTTYLALGDYYYKGRDFERAGLYYDSANKILDEKHPDYSTISKKSLLLSELLRHLITIKKQDSLLKLADDPVYREKAIDRQIELEKKNAAAGNGNVNNSPKPNNGTPSAGGLSDIGSFPFYNDANRARGAADFQSYWGSRFNRDYWRVNAKKTGNNGPDNEDAPKDSIGSGVGQVENVAENRKKYYKEIPLTPNARKESLEKIETAIMGAAGVYQNSFNEPATAIWYYKELLRRFPTTRFEAQALYEIAKLSKLAGNTADYKQYRDLLTEKYPESVYLKLLDDPNAIKNGNNSGPSSAKKEIQDLYESMYNAYKLEQFDTALSIKLRADKAYAGNELQAKFDYLAALCTIRMGKTEVGIEKLKQVVIDYPDSQEAKEAQGTIDAYEARKNPAPVVVDTAKTDGALWKPWDGSSELKFLLVYSRGANSNLIRAGLNDFSKENFIFETLEVSPVQSIGETIYLTVNNFSTADVCKQYLEFMQTKADFFASKGLFEYELAWISAENYQSLVINKRINAYIDYFKTNK